MTEPDDASTGSSATPFLGALAIIVAVVIAIWLFNVFSRDELTDSQQIGRAAAGQNDALQRGDFADFRSFTCAAEASDEAKVTAEIMGQKTELICDVGVAGLHRLLAHTRKLSKANVIIVVAGMEGALASVVGGLVSCPVIAVPTSVGYGSGFGGFAALLTMLNSCADGISVVNIDNGFGAAVNAVLINRKIDHTS